MARRRRAGSSDAAFGNLSFLDILANSIGAITFIFLMFFIIISGLIRPSEFRVITDSLPDARAESPYKISLAAAGGVEPYNWAILSGKLPEGVTLNPKTGALEGSPKKEGTYRFILKVLDDTEGESQAVKQSLVFRVREPSDRRVIGNMPLEISTGLMTPAAVGKHYDITLAATGGEEPYFWSVVDSLPPGLALQDDRVIGTPQASGDWRFILRVEDSAQTYYEKEFLVSVDHRTVLTEDLLEPLAIATSKLPHAIIRQAYNVALSANGGIPPYSWSLERGELPRGLFLDNLSGVITGEPRQVSETEFIVAATDSQGKKIMAKRKLGLTVDPIFFEATAKNPILTWWVLVIIAILVVVSIALLSAFFIGVQCPWDRSWRCKQIGEDDNGRTIYQCRHGHTFVNEPRLLSSREGGGTATD